MRRMLAVSFAAVLLSLSLGAIAAPQSAPATHPAPATQPAPMTAAKPAVAPATKAAPAKAATERCRDDKGKFIKCPAAKK